MELLINGKIKDSKKTDIDTGYFYGYGVFETILVREGTAILMAPHLERLNQGLSTLSIRKTVTSKDVVRAIAMLRCYNGALKVNVSEAHTVFSIRPANYTADQYKNGARLALSEVYRNPSSPTVYLKSMNYMDNILALHKAKDAGWQDVLFTNYRHEICETAVANIFFIKEGKLVTSPRSAGILEGVVRRWLLDNADVDVRPVQVEELATMDAAFITNSLLGIMYVSAIGEQTYKPHPIIRELTQKYVTMLKKSVEED